MTQKAVLLLSLVLLLVVAHDDACCDADTINANGNYVLKIKPDLATVTIGVQQKGKTSSQALQNLNRKVNTLISTIVRQGIAQRDYNTQNFNLRQDYSFENGERTLIGQIASQSIKVKLRGFDSSGSIIGRFIDAVSQVNGISINGVNLDREDKTSSNREARRLAFNDARTKAQQFAGLSNLKLGKILNIVDVNFQPIFPIFRSVSKQSAIAGNPTSVPIGEIEVRANVNTKWSLEG